MDGHLLIVFSMHVEKSVSQYVSLIGIQHVQQKAGTPNQSWTVTTYTTRARHLIGVKFIMVKQSLHGDMSNQYVCMLKVFYVMVCHQNLKQY